MCDSLAAAVRALRDGDLVVYPTETVYGLGGDALDATVVERVFEAKRRDPADPLSLAVPDCETAREYTEPGPRERAFMETFLPGPVTVVLERTAEIPDALTAGSDRVGVRVPDHNVASDLLDGFAPITATSANVSGRSSTRHVSDLDPEIETAAAVVVDGGGTPGGGSTVVDVGRNTIHRRGHRADAVERWLADN